MGTVNLIDKVLDGKTGMVYVVLPNGKLVVGQMTHLQYNPVSPIQSHSEKYSEKTLMRGVVEFIITDSDVIKREQIIEVSQSVMDKVQEKEKEIVKSVEKQMGAVKQEDEESESEIYKKLLGE